MSISTFIRRSFKKKRVVQYIDKNNQLPLLDKELSSVEVFAVDTEFDWRNTYFPKISLIQIATKNKIFLIDCLKLKTETVLRKYFEDKRYLKIFHSVRSDTNVLSKCLKIFTKNVYDIQIAEKIISNLEIKSYAKIVKKYFGTVLQKGETNSNWLKRPLTKNQKNYAGDDVDYLIEIYYLQKKILSKSDDYIAAVDFSNKESDLGNKSLKELRINKNKKRYSHRNKQIFIWREEVAEEDNVPPAYIFKEKYISQLSKISAKDKSSKSKVMTIIGDSRITEKFIAKFL
jgi:ribonuclease D